VEINEVRFVGSYERESQCPKGNLPEFAFIGRSNVGKSSLINMLTGRVNLARVSKQPGKTQLINFFNVDESWHLVDLPGYGYAKRSKKKREAWEKMIERYLVTRQTLITAFVLLDSRIPLQDIDLEFINWLGDRNVPFNIIYTKIDKLKKGERKKNTKQIEDGLLQYWNFLPESFVSSAEKGTGRKEILNYIGSLMGRNEEE
jgi:GTP-binding protein